MRTMPNPGFRNGLLLAAAALLSGSAIACGSSSSADSPPAGGNSSSSGAGGRGGAQSMAGTTSAGTGGAQNMAGATSAGSGGASMSAGAGGSSQAGSGGAAAGSGGAPTAGTGGGGNPFNGYNLISSSLIDGASTHWEQGRDIAFDSAGNIVVVGGTSSTDFPTTTGAYDRTYSGSGANSRGSAGDTDVFVSKFDRTGKMLWSTFLGSFNYDRAYAVEVASNDDVVIAGRAGEGFPTTAGVIQPNFAGDTDASPLYGKQDGFVTRLKADGSGLVWSTYFGSSGQGIIRDMDIDAQGNVYVALTGENAPLGYAPENTSGRNTIKGTGWEGYYGKISSDGKKLMFGTFYGGSNGAQDSVNPSIRVAGGEAFIVASTDATDVDCINNNAYQKSNAGGADLLVMRYAANYSKVFCTYLGGSGDEVLETHVIAPMANGNVVVAGGTTSNNFPTTASSIQKNAGGGYDGQVTVLSGDGSTLIASTYIGGTGSDGVEGLAIVPGGDIVFGGSTESVLPITANAAQKTRTNRDAMLGRFSPDLQTVRYLSYFGGSLNEEFRALAVMPNGDIALAGQTQSSDFPFKAAFDTTIEPGSYKPDEGIIYSIFSPK